MLCIVGTVLCTVYFIFCMNCTLYCVLHFLYVLYFVLCSTVRLSLRHRYLWFKIKSALKKKSDYDIQGFSCIQRSQKFNNFNYKRVYCNRNIQANPKYLFLSHCRGSVDLFVSYLNKLSPSRLDFFI